MRHLLRAAAYIVIGMLLAVAGLTANVRLEWKLDLAWVLVAAAAFGWPAETSAVAGLLFGLVLDGLSGGGLPVYTLSYAGGGLAVMLVRKAFYLRSFMAAWVLAVAGAELLWLIIFSIAGAAAFLGAHTRNPGLLSPYILSAVFLYPPAHLFAFWLLKKPEETQRGGWQSVLRTV